MLAYSTLTVKELWEQCQQNRDDNTLRLILADALDEDEHSGQVNADKEFADFIRRFSLGDGEAKCTYEEFRGFYDAYTQIGLLKTVKLTTPPNFRFRGVSNVFSLTVKTQGGYRRTLNSVHQVQGRFSENSVPPNYVAIELLNGFWPNVTFIITYHSELQYVKT